MSAFHPWRGHLARCFFIISTLASPALAQLDTQGIGMSDVWQRHFNNGQLFDQQNPDHAPSADPDGDGWTNFQESIAGTDPFSGTPPEGMVATYVTYLKDQLEELSEELIDLAIISWDTLPGKHYTVTVSSDLTAGSWLPVELPYLGDGLPAAISVILTDFDGVTPKKLFWRVAVQDTDTDGDGLTDHEEYLLGSNPYAADTSGDGIPDFWLAIHGLNPGEHHANVLFPNSDITAAAAYQAGVQAHSNATPDDYDGDGIPNHRDAVPDDPEINWEKTPETRYVWIEQVEKTGAKAVSRHGHILFPTQNHGSSDLSSMQVLWDSNSAGWIQLAGSSSWSGSGFQSGQIPDVFNAEWLHVDDMNDEGEVVGRSAMIGPYDPVAWVLTSALMKWQRTGTTLDQYAGPVYTVPSFNYIEPWGDLEKLLTEFAPRIADDGSLSATSYFVEEGDLNEVIWVVSAATTENHSNHMATLAGFPGHWDPAYLEIQYRSGATLGAAAGLLVEHDPNIPETILHYRNGESVESIEGLLPNRSQAISHTDISRTPATDENLNGRIWFSVNQTNSDAVFLEKRAGGTGPSRWHNPPSMAEGAICLNARGEAITATKVWRNGTYHSLYATMWENVDGEVENLQAIDLASNGLILLQVDIDGVSKTGLLVPVEILDVGTGLSASTLRASNVAPTVRLDSISLADVTVDGEAAVALVQVSGTAADAFAELADGVGIDSITTTTTGQSFAVANGAFSGTLQVPLGSGDARVELETAMNAAGRKGMVSFTLLTDYVPVPPPSLDPQETLAQIDGFAVEIDAPFDAAVADTLNVVVRGAKGLNFLNIPGSDEIDTVVADVFGKRLSLVEDAVDSLRFTAQDAELGEVVLQFAPADFPETEFPQNAGATLSAQNVHGGATLDFRFTAYREGHAAYQGYRVMALVENTVDSNVFATTTPDFGAVQFALTAHSGHDPLMIDTMDGTLTWSLPVNGSSQAELAQTDPAGGVFVPYSYLGSTSGPQRPEEMMMIITGVKNDGVFYGGTETIYRMRVPKLGNSSSQKTVTFTDPATSTTHQMDLEEDADPDWYRTKDFAVLDIDPSAAPASEHLLPGLSPQILWTVQLGGNVELTGETKKMTAKVQPNPSMAQAYDWEQGKFFAGPFWLWGDDLIFDKGTEGTRDYLKEGDADSEGIIEVNLVHAYDRVTVEVFPAKMDAQGELMLEDGKPVVDGDKLYHATHDHPDKVRKGIHRFWDGRVNRIKGGEQAVPNHQPSDPVLPPPPRIVAPDGTQYVVVRVHEDEDEDKVDLRRADDDGKKDPQIFTTALANIEKVQGNQNVIGNWQAQCDAITENHAWTEQGMARAAAHPYFLDPDFGYCLVRVSGEYTEDGVKVPIVEDMTVRAYAKRYFVYLQSDQKFNPADDSPYQLASDVVSYQWAGLLEPQTMTNQAEASLHTNAGRVKTSRHTVINQENTTKYPTAVVALQEEGGWRFYDVFKRLTQRGEIVILSHGNTNYISLENGLGGSFASHEAGEEPMRSPLYQLPKLELNTATIGLLSCFSGSEMGGHSLGSRMLQILDAGPAGLQRLNRVDCFTDICRAGHAHYYIDFTPPQIERWRDEVAYRQVHSEYAATVDSWNSEIESSGINPSFPVDYKPFTGNTSEILTEKWTLRVKDSEGGLATIKPGEPILVDMYIPARDYYFTLPYPPVGQTQSAQIWEAPLDPNAGNPRGVKRADITYAGITNLIGPSGVVGITEEIIPAEGNVLLLRVMMNEDGTLKPRGGCVHLRRYALQKFEIEENTMPDVTGNPGGDRLKRLRELHAEMDIGDGKNPSEISTIRMFSTTPVYQYNDEQNKKTSLDINHAILISPSN